MLISKFSVLIAAVLLMAGLPLFAGSITHVVVFGDSLSDSGNVYAFTGYPSSPNWNGRQSDGPVAVEYMAGALGATLANFAYNGATTGQGNIDDGGTVANRVLLPGMTATFNDALAAAAIPIHPDAAYVVWGGPNDMWLLSGPEEVPATIATAVTNLLTIAGSLRALGATNIIVPGMPDPSFTPGVQALDQMQPGVAMLLHAAATNFNAALQANLPEGMKYYDTNALFLSMIANPSAYGFTNVTGPCVVGGVACANPEQYLFWDMTHPTTAVHAQVGSEFARVATPEPAALWLTAAGLGLAAWRIRRRRGQ